MEFNRWELGTIRVAIATLMVKKQKQITRKQKLGKITACDAADMGDIKALWDRIKEEA